MLQTTPLTGTLGAKVSNVDLLQYDPQLVDEIKHALHEYKVLVIPGQETLTPDALLSFAENFGTAERAEHPNWPPIGDAWLIWSLYWLLE